VVWIQPGADRDFRGGIDRNRSKKYFFRQLVLTYDNFQGVRTVPRQSLPELTAGFVREGLLAGRWGGTLPGETKLALELGVCRHTLRAALRVLEAEGLLV
jgi:hypothetical protein